MVHKASDTVLAQCFDYLSRGTGDGRNIAVALKHEPLSSQKEVAKLFDAALFSSRQYADNIVAALTAAPSGATELSERLLSCPTKTFKTMWQVGSMSFQSLVLNVILNESIWKSEEDRAEAEKSVFILLLAKLLEAGVDHPEIALFGVARLLAKDWKALADKVDSDAFTELFSYLDSDEKEETQSQATLAVAKMFDIAPERTERELHSFARAQVESKLADKIAVACFAVATLFPVMPTVTSKIVLQDGFLSILTALVDTKGSQKLRISALQLLSAGCMDGACRKAIREHCDGWAWKIMENPNLDQNSKERATAAVLVAKLRAETQEGMSADNQDLIGRLRSLTTDEKTFDQAVEALSYQSTQPNLKKAIADDSALLKRIIQHLLGEHVTAVQNYTALQLFASLSSYPPALSEEQKKLLEVKAYADGSKPQRTHPLDEDGPVSERCKQLLDAGIASALVRAVKRASPALLVLISRIIASLSKHPKHRGVMVQQGLLDICIAVANMPDEHMMQAPGAKRNAALAIARILVPLDPTLVFAKRPVERAISPLVYLLGAPAVDGDSVIDERWWRGFPVLNALQSLANLATLQGTSAQSADFAPESIVTRAWDTIEEAWQSDATALRTAATELILNLTQCQGGQAKFDESNDTRSSHRWRIMSAYFGDAHLPLRSAAGGAIAGLVTDSEGAAAFSSTPHGLDYTFEALRESDSGMQARAAAICYGMAAAAASKSGKAPVVAAALQKAGMRMICENASKQSKYAPDIREQLGSAVSMLPKA